MPTTILDLTFSSVSGQPVGPNVGAGSQLGTTDLYDVVGNIWKINANVLNPINGDANLGKNLCVCSETAQDVRVDVYWTAATSQYCLAVLRAQATSGGNTDNYRLLIGPTGSQQVLFYKNIGGVDTTLLTTSISAGIASGKDYKVTFSAVGTTLSATCRNVTDGVDLTFAASGTTTQTLTDSAITSAGRLGVTAYLAAAMFQPTRLVLTNVSSALTYTSTVITSNTSTNSIAATWTGGTINYTVKYYGSTTPNFVVGAGTLLHTSSAVSGVTDTYAHAPGNTSLWFYVVTVTDSAGSPATVTAFQVAGALQTVAAFLGIADSLMAYAPGTVTTNGTYTWLDYFIGQAAGATINTPAGFMTASGFPGILQNYGPRSITKINRAVAGTTTTDWLPSDPHSTGYYAAAVTAANAATPKSTDLIFMLGGNDAAGSLPAATYIANVTTILTAFAADVPTLVRALVIPWGYDMNTAVLSLNTFTAQYNPLILALPTKIGNMALRKGPVELINWGRAINAPTYTFSDGHLTVLGAQTMAMAVSGFWQDQFFGPSNSATGSSGSGASLKMGLSI